MHYLWKNYRVQIVKPLLLQRLLHNPFKHLRWSVKKHQLCPQNFLTSVFDRILHTALPSPTPSVRHNYTTDHNGPDLVGISLLITLQTVSCCWPATLLKRDSTAVLCSRFLIENLWTAISVNIDKIYQFTNTNLAEMHQAKA